jgi:hypothetical protein
MGLQDSGHGSFDNVSSVVSVHPTKCVVVPATTTKPAVTHTVSNKASIACVPSINKKPRTGYTDEIFLEYRIQKDHRENDCC